MADPCNHNYPMKKNIFKNDFSFCLKCGTLILINNRTKINSIKPKNKKFKIEYDPMLNIERMKEYITSQFENENNNQISTGYLIIRKQIIKILKRKIKKYKFSNETFVLSLNYMDMICKHKENCNMTLGSKLELMTIGCFLLAVKFAESDPYLPDFFYIESSELDYFNMSDVKTFEIKCLKLLNYNLDNYTSIDILNFFINHGIIFEDEMNTLSSSFSSEGDDIQSYDYEIKIENIFSYAYEKLNQFVLSNKSLNFNPMQIALSVICLTRINFELDDDITDKLLKIYGYNYDYFSECMKTIKEDNQKLKLNQNNGIVLNFAKNTFRFNSNKITSRTESKLKSHTTLNILQINKNKELENKIKITPNIKKIELKPIQVFRNSILDFPRAISKGKNIVAKSTNSVNSVKINYSSNVNKLKFKNSSNFSTSSTKESSTSLSKVKFYDLKSKDNPKLFHSSGKLPIIVKNNNLNKLPLYNKKNL